MKKKIVAVMFALGLILGGCSSMASKTEHVEVMNANGLIILDQEEKENRTTIVAKAVPADDFGFEMEDGEVIVQNVFDYTDFVILTPRQAKNVKLGGIYLVTFNHDDVEIVKENNLVIANKVFGQEIKGDIEN